MEEREENTEMIVYPLPNGRGQVALTARDGAEKARVDFFHLGFDLLRLRLQRLLKAAVRRNFSC